MKKKKVLVALSGGVDSSVSAALLLRDGYDVEGAFVQTWTPPWMSCTWREERRDAMRVAATLRIPFHTVDLSREYEEKVVSYLVEEYRVGRVPNPDVMCNMHIKFGSLFAWAIERGFDYIATGHYARVYCTHGESCTLHAGTDTAKDQSYFLWTLSSEQLQRVLFPIGALEKTQVRELAQQFLLPTVTKKDSQGICFLGKVHMKEFLSHYIPPRSGSVLNEHGVEIGVHDGAMYYTFGQRHGFTLFHTTPDQTPLYVIDKDITLNTIIVSPKTQHDQVSAQPQRIFLKDIHWISGTAASGCSARLRYRQPLFPVRVVMCSPHTGFVEVDNPEPYVQPGQSLVFYQGDNCLGGGVIAEKSCCEEK